MTLDSENWGTEPVALSCDQGHTWPARELEAWHLADVILQARVQHPGFDDVAEELARQQAEDRA
ncbi:hypothetical protein [Streptomyces sp. CB03911]|uniref:hypothetical protein n=1 Tax=Streptomyces sp. CB03911 TaxID=1804758 RepID=UPI0018FE75F8|nr:hypothetical protein [Streptomyces sp. CB03911]